MTQRSQSLALSNTSTLAMAISNPGALGTIEAYIGAVNRLPMLSHEQEVELGERVRDNVDLDAARELITSHLQIGRASWRARVCQNVLIWVIAGSLKKKDK